MLSYLALGLLFTNLLIIGILWIRLKPSRIHREGLDAQPISILVAVRDEEKTISRCIKAFQKLEYLGKMEFLFGDDQSTDSTAEIIQQYAKTDSRIRYYSIEEYIPGLNGKANALEWLSKYAEGEFLFVTDADIRVNSGWVRQLLGSIQKDTSLVSGVTMVEGTGLFSKLQNLDWIYAQGMLKVVADVFSPMTAIGNNMIIEKEKLKSIGGFKAVAHSLTEDYALANALKEKQYRIGQELNQASLGYSLAVPGILSWFQQRKRWMTGVADLSWWLKITLLIQALRLSAIVVLYLTIGWLGLLGLFVFWILDFLFLYKAGKYLLTKINFFNTLIYQIFFGIVAPLSVFYYFWPSNLVWKGRKY